MSELWSRMLHVQQNPVIVSSRGGEVCRRRVGILMYAAAIMQLLVSVSDTPCSWGEIGRYSIIRVPNKHSIITKRSIVDALRVGYLQYSLAFSFFVWGDQNATSSQSSTSMFREYSSRMKSSSAGSSSISYNTKLGSSSKSSDICSESTSPS